MEEENNGATLIEQRDQSEARRINRPGTLAEFGAMVDPIVAVLEPLSQKIRDAKVVAWEQWDVWNHLDKASDLLDDVVDRLTEATIYAQCAEERRTGTASDD